MEVGSHLERSHQCRVLCKPAAPSSGLVSTWWCCSWRQVTRNGEGIATDFNLCDGDGAVITINAQNRKGPLQLHCGRENGRPCQCNQAHGVRTWGGAFMAVSGPHQANHCLWSRGCGITSGLKVSRNASMSSSVMILLSWH